MQNPKPSGAERRRFVRISATLWIQIVGLDEEPQPRRGNISMSGAYFEIDRLVASPGNACLLRLGATREGPFIEVMSRVVRVLSYDDLWDGHVAAGVAFDFMVSNNQTRQQIARIVRLITEGHLRKSSELKLGTRIGTCVNSEGSEMREAFVEQISLNGLMLQTDWPMRVGETIRISIEAPATQRQFQFEGQVVRAQKSEEANAACYSNEIRFDRPGRQDKAGAKTASDLTVGYSIADAVKELMAETIGANLPIEDAQPVQSLKGVLPSVQLASVLGFLELERMTGSLSVTRGGERTILFVSNGKLVDIVGSSMEDAPVEALAGLLYLRDGEFEFAACPIDRADRFPGRSTSALLLELAARQDEQGSVLGSRR